MSSGLVVTITSFSFKRGLPVDTTTHGGGYIFDCRCLPNPGRLEHFKSKTGLQEEVIRYLEEQEELEQYFSSVKGLVDMSVKKYLTRGFEHLMISFGCTGGQHRSVYLACRLGEYLENFDVTVQLHHKGLIELGFIEK